MKKIRNYKTLAFGLAVLLFMLQITSSAAIWQTEKAKAATGPQDTSTIVVSGAAVTVDPNIVMSAVTAVEITKYSIAYQWSAVPNATSYYVYKYDTVQEKYDFYTVTTGTSIQVAGLAAGEEYYFAFYAVNDQTACRSDFVVSSQVFTKPEKVENFTISDNTTTSVVLR